VNSPPDKRSDVSQPNRPSFFARRAPPGGSHAASQPVFVIRPSAFDTPTHADLDIPAFPHFRIPGVPSYPRARMMEGQTPPAWSERRAAPRIRATLARLDTALPIWDLCCDAGIIGRTAMDDDPAASIVFVDKRPHIVEALEARLAREPRYAGRHRVLIADIRQMPLPPSPVNLIVAGVGTNLICAFLARLRDRHGDRIVASTSQNPERFERLAAEAGFLAGGPETVTSREGRQTIWTLRRQGRASR
jgi:hypothetical protein